MDDKLKFVMVRKITNRIVYDEDYRNYLLETVSTYHNTLNFIESALEIHEKMEFYEVCTVLVKLQEDILKNISEKLAF